MSFDLNPEARYSKFTLSQSLSSRAMSFDLRKCVHMTATIIVSIPFEQGDVFRQRNQMAVKRAEVSIPFEQGDVFRLANVCV